jgi:hypothetical protein
VKYPSLLLKKKFCVESTGWAYAPIKMGDTMCFLKNQSNHHYTALGENADERRSGLFSENLTSEFD